MNPQINSEPASKAGLEFPEGLPTFSRLAGSTRSRTAIRATEATSRGSRTRTGLGVRHQPSTGVTRKSDGKTY